MSDNIRHVIGVASVVRDRDGRILLIKTEKAGWELPGGQVEEQEDFISALKREVQEETGCGVEVGRLAGITSHVAAPPVTILTFLCRHMVGDPEPGDDSLDVGWFMSDEAATLITHPLERIRLEDALNNESHVIYRAYSQRSGDTSQRPNIEMLSHRIC
jgi:8-oxo-dGTP diphosphatase